MNLFTFKNKGKYFYLILISNAILVIVTVLALSLMLFVNFENIGISMTNNYMNDILNQISYTSSYLNQSAKSVGVQILLDPDVKRLMYREDPDIMIINNAIHCITLYRNTAPFIESIYIYNQKLDKFYSTKIGADTSDDEMHKLVKSGNVENLVPYPLELQGLQGKNHHVYSFVFTNNLPGAIIVNVKEEWLRKMIDSLNIHNSNDVFIIDNSGCILSHPSRSMFKQDISDKSYIKDILSDSNGSGCFVSKPDGVKSIISFASSEITDWKFISVIPYSAITKPIDLMKVKTVVICAVILFSCLILTFRLSYQVYSPLNEVVSKIVSLFPVKSPEKEKRVDELKLIINRFSNIVDQLDHLKDQKRIIKNEALMNLLTGVSSQKNNSVYKLLEDTNLKINLQGNFQLILLKIDNYRSFIDTNDTENCSLLRHAICNICTEIIEPAFPVEVVDFTNDYIVIILNLPDSSENLNSTLIGQVEKIQNAVRQYLNISLSAAISRISDDISQLNELYKEVLEISAYRIRYGHRCILTPGIFSSILSDNYVYPTDKEKSLTDAIKLGSIKNAEEIYHEIIAHCLPYPNDIINLCVLRLAFSISNTLTLIENNGQSFKTIDFNYFLNNLNSLETIDQINSAFIKLLQGISAEFDNKKNNKYENLVNSIIKKINTYYYDPNMTVNSIADDTNMSAVYLSRIFKEYTSESILDYMNRVKLEKAKELLTESSYTVNDISGKVGFINPKYFYTFFKKKTGVTPNEYRSCIKRQAY